MPDEYYGDMSERFPLRIVADPIVPPGEAWFVNTDVKHEVSPDRARVTVTHHIVGKIINLEESPGSGARSKGSRGPSRS